jgi:hypothetical protein
LQEKGALAYPPRLDLAPIAPKENFDGRKHDAAQITASQ